MYSNSLLYKCTPIQFHLQIRFLQFFQKCTLTFNSANELLEFQCRKKQVHILEIPSYDKLYTQQSLAFHNLIIRDVLQIVQCTLYRKYTVQGVYPMYHNVPQCTYSTITHGPIVELMHISVLH